MLFILRTLYSHYRNVGSNPATVTEVNMEKDNLVVKIISGLISINLICGLIVVILTLKSLNKFAKNIW